MSNPAHLKVGGDDDDLDKLLRQVSMGFLHSPISPSDSIASPTFSEGWTTRQSSSRMFFFIFVEKDWLAQEILVSAEVYQTPAPLPPDEGQSTNFRLRRLPPTPQAPPIATTSISIPPPPPPPLPVPAFTHSSQPSTSGSSWVRPVIISSRRSFTHLSGNPQAFFNHVQSVWVTRFHVDILLRNLAKQPTRRPMIMTLVLREVVRQLHHLLQRNILINLRTSLFPVTTTMLKQTQLLLHL